MSALMYTAHYLFLASQKSYNLIVTNWSLTIAIQKIGLYSGTFDPIHKGHIAFALEALAQGGLDMVIFLPEGNPRKKPHVIPLEQRVEQIVRALNPYPKLTVARLSSSRFTYATTINELREKYTSAQLTLLVGSDVAKGLVYGWEDAEKLFAECSLIIGLRNNDTKESLQQMLADFNTQHSITPLYCTTAYPDESSSMLRGH